MTLEQKAKKYAREHPQRVFLSWVDGSQREYDSATKAVELCRIPRTAACIIAAECEDKTLEKMLNDLLDHE